ncbi:hypothetical protein CSR02_06360 [Acetobacter pomorum]|uniref:DUF4410 domain-containing protein n=1 Tax=Acetobacter pomorum TaxID=65959 RepID=A0A2G4REV9_9PROT|nr:hypothetical protein [Acetobacter pomorum]PHY94275.1 hypothetical protein CSR02_06360 [Acetobacter pomorum]GBR48615.1 hypothetical protein AA11825_1054 [Acetobacter pomorum DSM 11825]
MAGKNGACLIALALVLGACSARIPLNEASFPIQDLPVDHLVQTPVVYRFAPGFEKQNAQIACSLGINYTTDLGPSAEARLQQAVRSSFAHAQQQSAASHGYTLAFSLQMADEQVTVKPGMWDNRYTVDTTLKGTVQVLDAQGQPVQVVPITGLGSNTEAGSCGALKRAMMQASEKAVAQIGNDFVAKVANGHVLN